MIRKCQVLFCDNEHGTGDVTFPDLNALDVHGIEQVFIEGNDARSLRRAAKQAGWSGVGVNDYCPSCTESM